jgi:hypothetical protein
VPFDYQAGMGETQQNRAALIQQEWEQPGMPAMPHTEIQDVQIPSALLDQYIQGLPVMWSRLIR